MTANGSARFQIRTAPPAKTKNKTNKCYTCLISCCLFLAILCACLLAALVLIGKHLYLNRGEVIQNEGKQILPVKNRVFRLPNDTWPIHYNLTLIPNVENGSFKGKVNITLKIIRSRTNLIVHNKNLTITDIKVSSVNQSKTLSSHGADIDESLEIATIRVPEELIPGIYHLYLEFSGSMLNKYVGLYKSTYSDKITNKKRSIATSKFEPTYARQAFPCFDEPNMKAKYTVHILRPKEEGYIALSNMPEVNSAEVDGGVMVNFQESKQMSTYLSCFIVCDFKSKNDIISPSIGDSFPLRVFSTAQQLSKTDLALSVGKKVMEYFIDYFGIAYPLPKLDLIAIPDFVSGAMEHWGLVTFRETSLLFDEKIGSTKNQQRIATVVSHELAHSWFGNLVTMNWWNDLWLNEGFASYIQYKGVDFIYPKWQMMDQFLTETLHAVLSLDATSASHPIVQTVQTPDQITEIFDTITYNKGSSVLRMLDHAITQDTFQKGVNNYLVKHQWGNAVTQDLWDQLQKLVESSINITDFMNTWTVQMGYPIITVIEDGNNYVFTQKRFLKDYNQSGDIQSRYEYKWTIPITYVTDKNSEPVTIWFNHDQSDLKMIKPEGIKWIKFNHNQVGFYRVNYGPKHWEVLADNIDKMTTSDKTHLLEESFSIAESGDIKYNTPLELTKYLKNELNSIPWSVASSALSSLKKFLVETLDYDQYTKYILLLVTPAYEKLTWNESPNDTHLMKQSRSTILNLACANNHKDCIKTAVEKFRTWLEEPTKSQIPQDLKRTVYYYGMKYSGSERWFKVLELFKRETDATEKLNMLYALSAIREPWLLHHLIQLGTIEGPNQIIRGQDYFTMLQYISGNTIGSSIVWTYVRENWPYLVKRFGLNDRYLGKLIPSITSGFTTKTSLEEMNSFFEQYPEAGAGQAARQEALANVNNNIKWIEKNRNDVIQWLKDQKLTIK